MRDMLFDIIVVACACFIECLALYFILELVWKAREKRRPSLEEVASKINEMSRNDQLLVRARDGHTASIYAHVVSYDGADVVCIDADCSSE